MKTLTIPYIPRAVFNPFHARAERGAILVCHRRLGKTVATINDILSKAVYTQKERARYGYIAPFYSQAKQIAWDYLKHYSKEVAVKTSESALSVELFNGARCTLYGADNPDSFRGLYFDGVVVDEYGNCRPNLWSEILRPALSDRRGWWVFIGTPNGPNHFYEAWERAIAASPGQWYHLLAKSSETNILDAAELAAMRLEMTEDEYEQELECSWFAGVRGAFYAEEMKKARVGDFPVDAIQPCHYIFDLGFTDTTAVWRWQEYPEHIKVSLALEWDSRPIKFYIDWLHHQREQGLKMGNVWVPHDAKAKSLQTGRSIVEQMLSGGIVPRVVPKLDILDGIAAARQLFPQLVFDETGCYDGLRALKSYHREWNDEKQAFMAKPLHDWSSNFADAFRYLALVARLAPNLIVVPSDSRLRDAPANYAFSLEDLYSARPARNNRI